MSIGERDDDASTQITRLGLRMPEAQIVNHDAQLTPPRITAVHQTHGGPVNIDRAPRPFFRSV
jgi:hypothetical protein